jgi:hypothetical protein
MTDTTIDWGEFAGNADGQYPDKFRFNEPGDSIAGIVRDVRIATMPDGTRLPSLEIEDTNGTTWSVLAGPVGLQRALATHRPATGDTIAIVFTGNGEAKPGKSAPKLFDVVVKRGDEGVPAAAAPAPAPAAPSASSLI